jgi:hypothetical protein
VVRIGMALDSVRVLCPIVRDTSELNEGDAYPVAYALVAGDTLRLEIDKGAVWRISVTRPTYLTVDSIHVGTPLSSFIANHNPEVMVGEGHVVLVDKCHPGNSFGLSREAISRVPGLTAAGLATLPRSTFIEVILVVGHQGSAPPSCAEPVVPTSDGAESTAR